MKSKSKYGLDQFYTKVDIAQKCLSTLNLENYDCIVEPSAGDGSFYNLINHNNKIGFDIDPKCEGLINVNYLTLDSSPLKTMKVLVCGNPPFGRNSSLALQFIKKSCEFATTIAFILPKGFKKRSTIDKIPLNFKIISIEDLSDNNFTYEGKDYSVPCVWMVLEKTTTIRDKEVKLIPNKFSFTKQEGSNLAIRRVGVNAGTPFINPMDVSIQSHYFLKVESPITAMEVINKTLFSFNDTTGPRSISKNELILVLDHLL